MESEVIVHSDGGVTYSGRDAVELYRARQLALMLRLYSKTGIKPTRSIGVMKMLGMAERYTGKKYKRSQAAAACNDVMEWHDNFLLSLPVRECR